MSVRRLMDKFKARLKLWFTDVHHERTAEQLEAETWLIPKLIPFSRWYLLPAAVFIQACLGTLYACSGYNLPIEAKLYGRNGGVDRAIAVNVFYLCVAWMPIAAATMGPWLERNGPKKGALLGASIFYLGHLIVALGCYAEQIAIIYIGYGLFFATGLGIAYISPVSPLQKLFPEMRGFAGGLAVCGYGAGSIIAPYAQKALIGKNYAVTGEQFLGLELTWIIMGSIYFVIMTTAALVLRMPPPGYEVNGVNIHTVKGAEKSVRVEKRESVVADKTIVDEKVTREIDDGVGNDDDFDMSAHCTMTLPQSILSKQYWMIYFMFFGCQMTGLVILSKIQSIVQNQLGKSPDEAANINAVLGGMNLLGRAVYPIISDLLKTRRVLFLLAIAGQLIMVGCLPTAMGIPSYAGVLICYFAITFFYGGAFGMIPAFLADQFGAKNVGATHGLILTAWAIDGVAGVILFTTIYNHQKHAMPDSPLHWYDLNFRWLLIPLSLAFLVCLFIPCNLRDNRLPKVPGETLRFRLLNLPMVRIMHGKAHILTKKDEDAEWERYIEDVKASRQKKELVCERPLFSTQTSEMSLISPSSGSRRNSKN